MISIEQALQAILQAVYGREVRNAIHDAIAQINDNANEAIDLSQIKFGSDIDNPTDPVGSFIENTVYFNTTTGRIWKLLGGAWNNVGTMKTINRIDKSKTVGLEDTYTITYSDGTTSDYVVKNGASISNITKDSTTGNVDQYVISLDNGQELPNKISVTNGLDGVSITDVTLASTVGYSKNYNINLSNGTTTPHQIQINDGVSSFLYVRYSSSFDGTGMVTTPNENTVYIGFLVTTQPTAPTDPSLYNWVRFVGKSGTGSGDMLTTDYVNTYPGTHVVDYAAALWNGSSQILANELLTVTDYATNGNAGTVDKATKLVDVINNVEADTEVLAKLSDDNGSLLYNTDVHLRDMNFTSDDTENISGMTAPVSITAVTSNEAPTTFFNKITNAFKNIRWLLSKMGNTDISTIGSGAGIGTVTGAISTLNDKLDELPEWGTSVTIDTSVAASTNGVVATLKVPAGRGAIINWFINFPASENTKIFGKNVQLTIGNNLSRQTIQGGWVNGALHMCALIPKGSTDQEIGIRYYNLATDSVRVTGTISRVFI